MLKAEKKHPSLFLKKLMGGYVMHEPRSSNFITAVALMTASIVGAVLYSLGVVVTINIPFIHMLGIFIPLGFFLVFASWVCLEGYMLFKRRQQQLGIPQKEQELTEWERRLKQQEQGLEQREADLETRENRAHEALTPQR